MTQTWWNRHEAEATSKHQNSAMHHLYTSVPQISIIPAMGPPSIYPISQATPHLQPICQMLLLRCASLPLVTELYSSEAGSFYSWICLLSPVLFALVLTGAYLAA
jgi:hypothetical protein